MYSETQLFTARENFKCYDAAMWWARNIAHTEKNNSQRCFALTTTVIPLPGRTAKYFPSHTTHVIDIIWEALQNASPNWQ